MTQTQLAETAILQPSQTTSVQPGVSYADMANAIRFLTADAVQKANSGHPGMPMGMADVATVLFTRYLKFDPENPEWPDRDRFVLSAGHGSMLLYSLLYLTGYPEMTIGQIKNFRQLGSLTAGHPEYGLAPGIETTTGPLGQGIANGVGLALAEKLRAARFGKDLVDHHTYVITGDGCLMEGISYEAVSFAGHLNLSKLIVFWDDNSISIDGPTELTQIHDHIDGFRASGWDVQSINGHDPTAIDAAIQIAQLTDTPSLIACRTVIGYGAPTKAGTEATHGAPLGEDEVQGTREALNWPHPPFEVPEPIIDAWHRAGRRSQDARKAWQSRLNAVDAHRRAEFERSEAGGLPAGWHQRLDMLKREFAEDGKPLATRLASGQSLGVLTEEVPEMIGGSADLTGSVNTKPPGMEDLTAHNFGGRYIRYGVREHGMAGIMNGIALHGGFIPYGGTFLVFVDYMRASMRLSALMHQRVIYVLTHDSIGVGEDGPTHQPVETLALLRSMPNFHVFRPCDSVETVECWQLALENHRGPSGMVLTRQGVPQQCTQHTEENLSARGAYVLAEGEGGKRQVTLLATGSEVQIAMAARETLQADGISTAVVSMPCWELFDAQEESYRQSVLGKGTIRIAVEAGVRMGWDKYIRNHGGFVGMEGFGASAPAVDLYKHFGITAEHVVDEAKARL